MKMPMDQIYTNEFEIISLWLLNLSINYFLSGKIWNQQKIATAKSNIILADK